MKNIIPHAVVIAVSLFLFFYYKESHAMLLAFIPAAIGTAYTATNTESPIEPARLWYGVIACIVTLLVIGLVGATKMFG